MADENANFHLQNTNRNLNADFLDVIYRMAAGEMPGEGDFFIESDMGPLSLDSVRVRVSPESLHRSLERLRRDPSLLDYVSLAVPRGFVRPGAVMPRARVELRATSDGAAVASGGSADALAAFDADATGGFDLALDPGSALDHALAGKGSLWLAARDAEGAERVIELKANDHGGKGHTVLRASRDGAVTLRR